jgi:very-short-patch-repair endonuclease
MLNYNKDLKTLARELRKNMTDAEKLLWSRVRRKRFGGCQFYRQAIINNYIVDFYCPAAKLVIEIDGGQHYYGDQIQDDKVRDRHLTSLGLMVFRYSNLEVLQNIDLVLEHIYEKLNPPTSPFAKGGK